MFLRHKKKVVWNSEGRIKLGTAEFRVPFEPKIFYFQDIAKVAYRGSNKAIFFKIKMQNILHLPVNNQRLCSSLHLIHLDSSNQFFQPGLSKGQNKTKIIEQHTNDLNRNFSLYSSLHFRKSFLALANLNF